MRLSLTFAAGLRRNFLVIQVVLWTKQKLFLYSSPARFEDPMPALRARRLYATLLASVCVLLAAQLPLGAQQSAPATQAAAATSAPPAGGESQTIGNPAASGRARRPPMTAVDQEIDLGLTAPANPSLPSLILVGDSTVRNGHGTGSDGQWGWGHPLHDLFDPAKINVVNRAIGGLSSHSYISQGHWANTLALIKPGDYVLIQWGHNDGGLTLPGATPIPDAALLPGQAPPAPRPGAPPRGQNVGGSLPGIGEETIDVPNPRTGQTETVHTYGWYLRKYIADVKAKDATPIICSLVPRKLWFDGHIIRQTSTYRGWARQVAEQEHVGFVDLNEIIARQYDALGPTAVEPLFADPHTHQSIAGATLNAESVVAGLRALPGDPLAQYLSARGQEIVAYRP
jgi:lysophospholipase L1-like esterase